MFTKTPLLIASLGAGLGALTFAADDPAADAPATARAWLGVATAPVEEVLAAQLDLPEGVGAAVRLVVPDSPAAAAGINKHDILFEFEGELIRSPEHLSELVSARQGGESVDLAVIQRGKKREISAELAPRPAHLDAPGDPAARRPGGGLNLDDLGGFDVDILPLRQNGGDLQKQFERMREQIEKQFGNMLELEELDIPNAGKFGATSSRNMTFRDANGSVEIRGKDGKTDVTAKDADGNIVFEGPANTDEEREKIPAQVREKLEQFEGSGVELQLDRLQFGDPKLRVPRLRPEPKLEPVPPAEENGERIKV